MLSIFNGKASPVNPEINVKITITENETDEDIDECCFCLMNK